MKVMSSGIFEIVEYQRTEYLQSNYENLHKDFERQKDSFQILKACQFFRN